MIIAPGIGARLRQARDKTGLSQADFGKLGGVSRGSQVAYENDQTSPTVNYLAALDAAKVDVWYVLTGQPAPETAFDPDDEEMLRLFRALDPSDQQALRHVMTGLRHRPQNEKADTVDVSAPRLPKSA